MNLSQCLTVRGIIHCHTDFSYDGHPCLTDLCVTLQQKGFNFVALTEHSQGVSAEAYQRFVSACQRESTKSFVAIPGLEIRCSDGTEIAGIGIPELVEAGPPNRVVSRIQKLGGYALWVHPLKNREKWNSKIMHYDAIEVLNGKQDGKVAPNFYLIKKVRKYNQAGHPISAIFGLDLHDLKDLVPPVWIECMVSGLTSCAIVESLRNGLFINRVVNGAVCSSGKMNPLNLFLLMSLRFIYVYWNALLKMLPSGVRDFLVKASRSLVKGIKSGRARMIQ